MRLGLVTDFVDEEGAGIFGGESKGSGILIVFIEDGVACFAAYNLANLNPKFIVERLIQVEGEVSPWRGKV